MWGGWASLGLHSDQLFTVGLESQKKGLSQPYPYPIISSHDKPANLSIYKFATTAKFNRLLNALSPQLFVVQLMACNVQSSKDQPCAMLAKPGKTSRGKVESCLGMVSIKNNNKFGGNLQFGRTHPLPLCGKLLRMTRFLGLWWLKIRGMTFNDLMFLCGDLDDGSKYDFLKFIFWMF